MGKNIERGLIWKIVAAMGKLEFTVKELHLWAVENWVGVLPTYGQVSSWASQNVTDGRLWQTTRNRGGHIVLSTIDPGPANTRVRRRVGFRNGAAVDSGTGSTRTAAPSLNDKASSKRPASTQAQDDQVRVQPTQAHIFTADEDIRLAYIRISKYSQSLANMTLGLAGAYEELAIAMERMAKEVSRG